MDESEYWRGSFEKSRELEKFGFGVSMSTAEGGALKMAPRWEWMPPSFRVRGDQGRLFLERHVV